MTVPERENIFKDWMTTYRTLIFNVVNVYAFTSTDKDDLFQDIALQVWLSVPGFNQLSSDSTWVYKVSLNTAIKWIRKETRRVEEIPALEIVDQPTWEEKQNDRIDWLYEQIKKLREVDRSVCILMLEDFSYREIGEVLGITEGNVSVKVHRIKKHLKKASQTK